jgi:hypothetical protein
MRLIFLLLIGGCLLDACHKPISKKNEINKIEIATGGCLRRCPVIGIIIDSTLSLKYYGGYKAKLQGYYSGIVTQGFWDTLNMKLKHINFKKLDTTDYLPLDGEDAEVIFYWNKQKRHIFKSIDDDPDSISHVLIWIANSYKHIELHKLENSVHFETTYQFIQPPKPKLDQIRFPPPKKNRHGKKSDE